MEQVDETTSLTSISIGGKQYRLHLGRVPYLESFVRFQQQASPGTSLIHEPIDLFDEALAGLEGGFRQCFRRLEPDLTLFRRLCQTYEILCVDVVGGRSVPEIGKDLKAGRNEYEVEYKRCIVIKGDKSKARDAAFVLLYVILMEELEDTARLSNQFFGLVQFVLTHRRTFKLKTRRVIRAAYEERFAISAKQRARLDELRNGDRTFEEGEDVTTEDNDDDDDYDSDYWI